MADETSTGIVVPAAPDPGAKQESSPADLLLKVLGAVGTGIGILGFVTFFGGALIWVRADKAELPATEAVAVVPRSVLVVTGATFLFPALLIAVGVVALVFGIDLCCKLRGERRLKTQRQELKKLRPQAEAKARSALVVQQEWKTAHAALGALEDALATARLRGDGDADIERMKADAEAQRKKVQEKLADAESAVSAAARAKADVDNLAEKSEIELERGPLQWKAEWIITLVALIVVVPWVNGAIGSLGWSLERFALALVAVGGAAITVFVFRETEKFVWFGIVAFTSIGVYLATATYFSTHRNAKMQPVAALRTGHAPVVGSYIASTSESLYVGTFREPETPPRLVVIPRSQVTEMVIGPLLEQNVARRRAIAMALNECAEEVEKKPVVAAEPKPGEESQTEQQQPSEESQTGQQSPEYEKACTEPQEKALKRAEDGPAQLDQPG